MTETAVRPPAIGYELQYRVEQFYYLEAQLLDEWKYQSWLEMFARDLHYRLPVRHNRLRRQRFEDETAPRGIEMAHFDDSYETMAHRVAQRASGTNWAEDPAHGFQRACLTVCGGAGRAVGAVDLLHLPQPA